MACPIYVQIERIVDSLNLAKFGLSSKDGDHYLLLFGWMAASDRYSFNRKFTIDGELTYVTESVNICFKFRLTDQPYATFSHIFTSKTRLENEALAHIKAFVNTYLLLKTARAEDNAKRAEKGQPLLPEIPATIYRSEIKIYRSAPIERFDRPDLEDTRPPSWRKICYVERPELELDEVKVTFVNEWR